MTSSVRWQSDRAGEQAGKAGSPPDLRLAVTQSAGPGAGGSTPSSRLRSVQKYVRSAEHRLVEAQRRRLNATPSVSDHSPRNARLYEPSFSKSLTRPTHSSRSSLKAGFRVHRPNAYCLRTSQTERRRRGREALCSGATSAPRTTSQMMTWPAAFVSTARRRLASACSSHHVPGTSLAAGSAFLRGVSVIILPFRVVPVPRHCGWSVVLIFSARFGSSLLVLARCCSYAPSRILSSKRLRSCSISRRRPHTRRMRKPSGISQVRSTASLDRRVEACAGKMRMLKQRPYGSRSSQGEMKS